MKKEYSLEQAVKEAMDLEQMFQTPGWKVFNEMVLDVIDDHYKNLLDNDDEKQNKIDRAMIKALNKILGLPVEFMTRVKEEQKDNEPLTDEASQ